MYWVSSFNFTNVTWKSPSTAFRYRFITIEQERSQVDTLTLSKKGFTSDQHPPTVPLPLHLFLKSAEDT